MLLLLSILHLISEIFLLIVVKFYLHTWVCLCLCLVECCNFVGRMCDLLVLNSFEWWLIWAWWKIFRSSLGHTVAWLGPNHNETFFVLYVLLYFYKATSVFCSSRFIVLRSLDFEVCLKKNVVLILVILCQWIFIEWCPGSHWMDCAEVGLRNVSLIWDELILC